MKKQILFFPSAWSNDLVFEPQKFFFEKNYDVIFPNIHQFDNINDMADYVVKNYPNPYALVGLSLGGFIVQDIITRFPHYCSKVILMGTYSHAHSEEVKAFFQNCIDQVAQGKLNELTPLFTQAVLSAANQQNQQLVSQTTQVVLATGAPSCINHHKACITWQDHTAALKNVLAKVLILAGECDTAVPLETLQQLHKTIPDSHLKIIKNSGHLMTLEEPGQVNQVIQAWLN